MTPQDGEAAVQGPSPEGGGEVPPPIPAPLRWINYLTAAFLVMALAPGCLSGCPIVCGPREAARRAACQSNQKQLMNALLMYAGDYDDRLPPDGYGEVRLPALLHPYVKYQAVWICPSDASPARAFDRAPGDTPVSYGYNALTLVERGKGIRLSSVADPFDTIALAEAPGFRAFPPGALGPAGALSYRHPPSREKPRGLNAGWLDGHVKWCRPEYVETRATAERGRALSPGIDEFVYWNRR